MSLTYVLSHNKYSDYDMVLLDDFNDFDISNLAYN